ncbi:MAG: hypothetical protein JWO57_2585 [Pseudonocardiales bacterium]|nr:hypothetical protein [Pseudonocardiales bacterium]
MVVTLLAIALVVAASMPAVAVRRRRLRRMSIDPIARVLGVREFAELDGHLEAVARTERRRLEEELVRYLAGRAGHVVVVRKGRSGIALELSDGRCLALRGISCRALALLDRHTPVDLLRPESVARDALSCRLRLRGLAGPGIDIHARDIALTV